MSDTQTQIPTDTWVVATWDEYIQTIENPDYEKAKGYYYNGEMLMQMSPVGYDHSFEHTVIILAVNLFGILKGIPLNGLITCSFRKPRMQECQPDIAYYIGDKAKVIPRETKIINLNQYPLPDLAIEIADTTLPNDIGNKRLLYEEIGVAEYWVVDMKKAQIRAFAVADNGSRRIQDSVVLPGLSMSLLKEALERSREIDQSQVGAWLLQQFQAI
jgi:Uma2 family endonuclease